MLLNSRVQNKTQNDFAKSKNSVFVDDSVTTLNQKLQEINEKQRGLGDEHYNSMIDQTEIIVEDPEAELEQEKKGNSQVSDNLKKKAPLKAVQKQQNAPNKKTKK